MVVGCGKIIKKRPLTRISFYAIVNIQCVCKRGEDMPRNKYPEETVEKILDVS